MVARVNSAEGGTNGTAVTTANSGGASGDAWDVISKPSGTAFTFSTAAFYKGTLGYRATHGTANGTGLNWRWSLSGWTKFRLRRYFSVSAYPTSAVILAWITDASNSKTLAKLTLSTSGVLGVQNAAGTQVFTGSAPIGLNSDTRVELIVVPGTTTSNGTIRFCWGVGDAAATDTYASTSANTGTGGTLGYYTEGKLSGTWNATVDYDDFAADDASSSTFLGPSGSGAVVVDPTPAPTPVVPTWPPGPPFTEAVRNGGVKITYVVDASLGDSPVEGATGLNPIGGTITDTTRPGVRRALNVDFAGGEDLHALLQPIGTVLTVTARVEYLNKASIDVPMGVFDIDSASLSYGDGKVSLQASDFWVQLQRAQFLQPFQTNPNLTCVGQAVVLIQAAIGADVTVNVTASSLLKVTDLTEEKDRAGFIIKILASAGAWAYFDRYGVPTIADIPTSGQSAAWLMDASPSGVITSLSRESSRTDTRNVVVVSSSASDGEKFPATLVWDDDVSSPTYAGTDPLNHPETAGPFGLVVDYLDDPIIDNTGSAAFAGRALLSQKAGLARQASLGVVPNPAVDAYDVIDILSPRRVFNQSRVLERHFVDTVTHPLTMGPDQTLDARSVGSS